MLITMLLGGMGILLMLRVPVAFAMLLPSLGYIFWAPRISMGVALQQITALLDSFPLLAVPLFILVGAVANVAGLTDRLMTALLVLTGRIRGSLAYANVNSSLVFSWMSGSALADAAALGSVLIPSMKRNGYDPAFAAALTASSSMISPVMPPSISAVVYAVLTGSSVAATFFGGVIPALLIFLVLTIYVYFYTRKRPGLTVEPIPREHAVPALLAALPICGAPIILLGGILLGFFTPTEAAAVTAMYLILLSLGCRWLSLRGLWKAISGTATTTGQVMVIACAGALFSYIMAREQIPQHAAAFLTSITENPYLFLFLLNIFLLIVGLVLDPPSSLLVTVPIIYPIAIEYGIDPIHLGVIVIFNLTLGMLTPPVGLVLQMLAAVSNQSFGAVVKAIMPMLGMLFIALLIVTYVPATVTWLPRALGF